MAIGSSENFQRFCSNYIGTAREGFDRPILLANEEGQDWVRRTGLAWNQTIPAGTAGAEQIGVVAAHDVRTGKTRPIYGMGRHNHENSVAVPGYDDVVVISGDDTFSTSPASSQLYMYVADDSKALWNDEGTLYALAARDSDESTDKNDYFDIQPGDDPVEMEFIEVPRMIATGKKAGNVDITRMNDFPSLPAPPASIPDGPQWVLDQWGNLGNNAHRRTVFDFIRIEDTAYDKRPGMSNIMYLADSGRGTVTDDDPVTPAPVLNPLSVSTNGRVWKLELDEDNPLEAKLSVLIQGDDNPVKTVGEIHQPDNVETTAAGSLLVQEDPGSSQQFAPPFNQAGATTARIWRYDLNVNSMAPVASVDQDADEGPTDEDAAGESSWGAWESSGIVDASSLLGPGWFFVTIQAHTLWVDVAPGPEVLAPAGPDWTYKREGGQLLAIRIPGA
jgi:secreted PhoX family phosphatase